MPERSIRKRQHVVSTRRHGRPGLVPCGRRGRRRGRPSPTWCSRWPGSVGCSRQRAKPWPNWRTRRSQGGSSSTRSRTRPQPSLRSRDVGASPGRPFNAWLIFSSVMDSWRTSQTPATVGRSSSGQLLRVARLCAPSRSPRRRGPMRLARRSAKQSSGERGR
jgi:hypothetical protein